MRFFIAIGLLCIASGCYRPSPGGYLDSRAFYASRQHYRVRYIEGMESQRAMMPPGWRLTSHQLDANGLPYRSLMDPAHATFLHVDRNGDGLDDTLVHEPSSELHFEHDAADAEIWVRTLPLEGALGHRSIDFVANSLLEALVTTDAAEGKWTQGRRMQMGARVLEQGPVAFGPGGRTPGHGMVVQLFDRTAPDSGTALMALVLARPDGRWSPRGGRGAEEDPPMMVLFLYAAAPEAFHAHRGEFEGMLDRTDFSTTGAEGAQRAQQVEGAGAGYGVPSAAPLTAPPPPAGGAGFDATVLEQIPGGHPVDVAEIRALSDARFPAFRACVDAEAERDPQLLRAEGRMLAEFTVGPSGVRNVSVTENALTPGAATCLVRHLEGLPVGPDPARWTTLFRYQLELRREPVPAR